MSHGRPPRVIRYTHNLNMMTRVVLRVTRLTTDEFDDVVAPIRASLAAMREGVASELQWSILASACELALAIEDKGITSGMRGHIRTGESILASIRLRAMSTGAWVPVSLDLHEIDDLNWTINLHEHQLTVVSSSEAKAALDLATGRVRSDGGRVLQLAKAYV